MECRQLVVSKAIQNRHNMIEAHCYTHTYTYTYVQASPVTCIGVWLTKVILTAVPTYKPFMK